MPHVRAGSPGSGRRTRTIPSQASQLTSKGSGQGLEDDDERIGDGSPSKPRPRRDRTAPGKP
jgi:hypothetical protein